MIFIKNIKKFKKNFIKLRYLLLILGISTLLLKEITTFIKIYTEQKSIEVFYSEQEKIIETQEIKTHEELTTSKDKLLTYNYIAMLKIPKINLERGLVSPTSIHNNVNENIQILKESDYPDKENGNFILASHSGRGKTAYFKYLNKLEIDDKVYITFNGKEYEYKVMNYYEINKNGTAHIIRNADETTLTLITCISNTNKQIVYICELI